MHEILQDPADKRRVLRPDIDGGRPSRFPEIPLKVKQGQGCRIDGLHVINCRRQGLILKQLLQLHPVRLPLLLPKGQEVVIQVDHPGRLNATVSLISKGIGYVMLPPPSVLEAVI
jgi:hypothetical protein